MKTRKQKYIENQIRTELHIFIKYFHENRSKAIKKFGDYFRLEKHLVDKYAKQYSDKMRVKRYNRVKHEDTLHSMEEYYDTRL